MIFHGKAYFAPGTKIVNDGVMVFGKEFDMKARSAIICDESISFGDNVLISWDVLIMDTDMHSIYDENGEKCRIRKPVLIGSDVWVGCRATILKGVVIENGSMIGAGSIIRRKLGVSNALYIDEEPIREGIRWEK